MAWWLEPEWAGELRARLQRSVPAWGAWGRLAAESRGTEPALPWFLCVSFRPLHDASHQNLVAQHAACYLSFCGSGMWLCKALQLGHPPEAAASQAQAPSGPAVGRGPASTRAQWLFAGPSVALSWRPCHVGLSVGPLKQGRWFYQSERERETDRCVRTEREAEAFRNLITGVTSIACCVLLAWKPVLRSS